MSIEKPLPPLGVVSILSECEGPLLLQESYFYLQETCSNFTLIVCVPICYVDQTRALNLEFQDVMDFPCWEIGKS